MAAREKLRSAETRRNTFNSLSSIVSFRGKAGALPGV